MAERRYRLSVKIAGRRRYSLLFQRWRDIKGRACGRHTKRPDLYEGLELGWQSFAEFRAWALANGFSKYRSSPDRMDPADGYTPRNVVFVTIPENRLRALLGDAWRGEEPPVEYCPCCQQPMHYDLGCVDCAA